VGAACNVYISTIIKEISKVPCKKYLSSNENRKKNKLSKCMEAAKN
jgi:hypothetical protein